MEQEALQEFKRASWRFCFVFVLEILLVVLFFRRSDRSNDLIFELLTFVYGSFLNIFEHICF